MCTYICKNCQWNMLPLSQTYSDFFVIPFFAGVASLSSLCASIVIALTILFSVCMHWINVKYCNMFLSRHLLFHEQYVCKMQQFLHFLLFCKKKLFAAISLDNISPKKCLHFTALWKKKSKIFSLCLLSHLYCC
jgi:hypothetical protein